METGESEEPFNERIDPEGRFSELVIYRAPTIG